MVKYILLDLDGTVFDFNKGERSAFIKTIVENCNYKPSLEECLEFSRINEFYFKEYQNKKMTREEFQEELETSFYKTN